MGAGKGVLMNEPVRFSFTPRQAIRPLIFIALAFAFVSFWLQFFESFISPQDFYGLRDEFITNFDGNVPNYYSAVQLMLVAALLAVIAVKKRREGDRWTKHWIAMSILLTYLSVDEASALHEKSVEPIRDIVATTGGLYYAWVIPGLLAVVIIAVSFRRFVKALPKQIRRLLILAFILFVAGAAGGEMLEGVFRAYDHKNSFGIDVLTVLEELAEMTAVTMIVYALLTYIAEFMPNVHAHVEDEGRAEALAPAPAEREPVGAGS
jgi:hypothetical protein